MTHSVRQEKMNLPLVRSFVTHQIASVRVLKCRMTNGVVLSAMRGKNNEVIFVVDEKSYP